MSKKEYPTIPGYQIKKILGEGGMGIVYLAVQTALDRDVALKVTLPALAEMDESFTKRFVREARATAALNHKNIITVYDAGEFEKSSYLAMEYIATGTLADIERSELNDEEICQLFIGISQGLGSAHKAGFVHRDVKPDNILIDRYGRPVVTDFGIVKSLGTKNTALTIAGGTIGTPQYMSPEQIKAEELDGRSDLYSLGVMLYNLLEGHAPFSDPTPSAVYIMHVTTDPSPLSAENAVFQTIMDRLLQKNPNDRYANASELVRELRSLKDNKPEKKPKPETKQKLQRTATKVNLDTDGLEKTHSSIVHKKIETKKATNKNQTGAVKLAKTPPVTRKFVNQSSSGVSVVSGNRAKWIAVSSAFLLLIVAGVFAYNQYSESQNIDNQAVVQEGVKQEPAKQEKSIPKPTKVEDKKEPTNQQTDSLAIENNSNQAPVEQPPQVQAVVETKNATNINTKDLISTQFENEEPQLTSVQKDPTTGFEPVEAEQEVVTQNSNQKTSELKQASDIDQAVTPAEEPSDSYLNSLLALANLDLDNWKLMSPKSGNANLRFNQVLDIDPSNRQAKKGLLQVIHKYTLLANNKANSNLFSDAKLFASNALSLRNDYLSKSYDKADLLGVSDAITLNQLRALRDNINKNSLAYEKQKAQRLTSTNNRQDKDEYYKNGLAAHQKKNYQTALDWLNKAAELNHAESQTLLGDMYYTGQGVTQNDVLALSWYKKAAENNSQKAQVYIGTMYEQGSAVKQNYQKAIEWYNKAAQQKNAEAQHLLGLSYYNGRGVSKSDEEAVKWFRLAAKQGNPSAQNLLGWMTYKGKGIKKDHLKAVEWYTKAANQGLAKAQDNLGQMYFKGYGVRVDYDQAFVWYSKAANQGLAEAQGILGAMHEYGRGTRKSPRAAIEWYKKAAKQGDDFSIKKLRKRGITRYD